VRNARFFLVEVLSALVYHHISHHSLLPCWVIWTTRNEVIFYAKNCNLNSWKSAFKEELGLVCMAESLGTPN
jgi:hypothetical protein